jgi:hypothetical protein
MTERTSLAVQPRSTSTSGDRQSKLRKRTPSALERRAKAVAAELTTLPVRPLLIGAGIGAAVLGSAWAVSSKRTSVGSPLTGMNQTLTRTAIIALARVVSGQTVRSVVTSALLDVAEAMKA